MSKTKLLTIALLITALVFISTSPALASMGTTTLGSGTIKSITIQTDPVTKVTSVIVSLVDASGTAQTVRLSLETAISMGLVAPNDLMVGQDLTVPDTSTTPPTDVTGKVVLTAFFTDPVTKISTMTITLSDPIDPTIIHIYNLDLETAVSLHLVKTDATKVGTDVTIAADLILESDTYSKVVSKLGSFFGVALGVDYDTLAAYKDEGFGNGVLTQALWMATKLGGNAETVDQILKAKQSGDYSGIVLPDGSSASNWGQLKKALLTEKHQNLGRIMSGKATPLVTSAPTEPTASVTPDPSATTDPSATVTAEPSATITEEPTATGTPEPTFKKGNGTTHRNGKTSGQNGSGSIFGHGKSGTQGNTTSHGSNGKSGK